MKDKLEEFVRVNKDGFDMYEPRAELWKGIEKKITPKKEYNWHFYFSRAAIILVIFGTSFAAQHWWMTKRPKYVHQEINKEVEIPELKEAEMYYSSLINVKLEEVKPLLSNQPLLENDLKSDLSELDSIYNSLRHDLKDNIANNEVIEAMIQNYRLRISLLEDMLTFLERKDKPKEKNNIEKYDL